MQTCSIGTRHFKFIAKLRNKYLQLILGRHAPGRVKLVYTVNNTCSLPFSHLIVLAGWMVKKLSLCYQLMEPTPYLLQYFVSAYVCLQVHGTTNVLSQITKFLHAFIH